MTIRCIRIRRMRRSSRWLWWLPAESKFKTSVWFIWVTWNRIKVIVILNHIIHQKFGMVQIPDWFRSSLPLQPIRPPPTGVWRSCEVTNCLNLCIVQGPFETKSLFCWQILCSLKLCQACHYCGSMMIPCWERHSVSTFFFGGLQTYCRSPEFHFKFLMRDTRRFGVLHEGLFLKNASVDNGERWTDTPHPSLIQRNNSPGNSYSRTRINLQGLWSLIWSWKDSWSTWDDLFWYIFSTDDPRTWTCFLIFVRLSVLEFPWFSLDSQVSTFKRIWLLTEVP